MPSISAPFQVCELPSTAKTKDPVVTGSDNTVYVGIPGGSISRYRLKPSPHIDWSLALPPTCHVSALAVCAHRLVYASCVKNKHEIKVVRVSAATDTLVLATITCVGPVTFVTACDDRNELYVLSDKLVCYSLDQATENDETWSPKWMLDTQNSHNLPIYAAHTSHDTITLVTPDSRVHHVDLRTGADFVSDLAVCVSAVASVTCFRDTMFVLTKDGLVHVSVRNKTGGAGVLRCPPARALLAVSQTHVIAMSHNGGLSLLDTRYGAVVATAELARADHVTFLRNCGLHALVAVRGAHGAAVAAVSVDLGRQSLLECFGRGVSVADDSTAGLGISTLLAADSESALSQSQISDTANCNDLLASLEPGKVSDLAHVVDFLVRGSHTARPRGQAPVYYSVSDRRVTPEFVHTLVKKLGELACDTAECLQYLLTHPFYPVTDNLLDTLPDALHQHAVAHCPGLSCAALVRIAVCTCDPGLRAAAVSRVEQHFSTDSVAAAVRQLALSSATIFAAVDTLVASEYGYALAACLIDAVGPLGWTDSQHATHLTQTIESQLLVVQDYQASLALVTETTRRLAHAKKKRSCLGLGLVEDAKEYSVDRLELHTAR